MGGSLCAMVNKEVYLVCILSSPLSDLDDIITNTIEFILSLPAPLPNIILLGDFNMPEVIWDNPHAYNPSSERLIDLATLLFLN